MKECKSREELLDMVINLQTNLIARNKELIELRAEINILRAQHHTASRTIQDFCNRTQSEYAFNHLN